MEKKNLLGKAKFISIISTVSFRLSIIKCPWYIPEKKKYEANPFFFKEIIGLGNLQVTNFQSRNLTDTFREIHIHHRLPCGKFS